MNDEDKLKSYLLNEAKELLNQFESIYPISYAITCSGECKPIMIYLEDEHPDPIYMIKELEKGLASGLRNGDYRSIGIAIDVLITPTDKTEKIDGIEIRLYADGKKTNFYLPYLRQDSLVKFLHEDSYSLEGNIQLE